MDGLTEFELLGTTMSFFEILYIFSKYILHPKQRYTIRPI